MNSKIAISQQHHIITHTINTTHTKYGQCTLQLTALLESIV